MIPPLRRLSRIPGSFEIGARAIQENPYGIILLAGGQASRLGMNAPKGFLPVSRIQKKTLFQLFFEKCAAYPVPPTIGILIDPSVEKKCRDFLSQNAWFGCDPDSLFFLRQKKIPYLVNGTSFFKKSGEIAEAPNGNGGLFEAERWDELLREFSSRNIEHASILPVDNPLLLPLDQELVGTHLYTGADLTLSAFRKTDPTELVGAVGDGNNGPVLIDYPDIPDEHKASYPFGNINMYCAKTTFLHAVTEKNTLPYHTMLKKTECYDPQQNRTIEVMAEKRERFITDIPLYAQKTAAILKNKEKTFMPIKSQSDIEKATLHLELLDSALLETLKKPYTSPLELHPRYHILPPEELAKSIESISLVSGYIP